MFVELYKKNQKLRGFNPIFCLLYGFLGFGFFGVCGDWVAESEFSFRESWVVDFGSF